jgi:hypothetical protein
MLDAPSAALLIKILEQTSGKWESAADLGKAVKDLGKQAPPYMGDADPDFIVGPIDWNKLLSSVTDPDFAAEMNQSHGHGCALNASRFVLQKRYNVMIGQSREGDRIVYSLTENAYVIRKNFQDQVARTEISLSVAKNWLNALGIKTRDPVVVTNIVAYINQMRVQLTGMFLLAGDIFDADHTYVLYEFQTVGGELEAKIYNPLYGKNVDQDGSDWYNVSDFQSSFALPLQSDGSKINKLDPSGVQMREEDGTKLYLRPGDPALAAHAPLYYSIMFVPAL